MNIHYNTDWITESSPRPKLNILKPIITNDSDQEGLAVFTTLLNQQSSADKNSHQHLGKAATDNSHSTSLYPLLTLVQHAPVKTESALKPKKKQQRHK